jgi:hypothetical protein
MPSPLEYSNSPEYELLIVTLETGSNTALFPSVKKEVDESPSDEKPIKLKNIKKKNDLRKCNFTFLGIN